MGDPVSRYPSQDPQHEEPVGHDEPHPATVDPDPDEEWPEDD